MPKVAEWGISGMTRSLVGTLCLEDYQEIAQGVDVARRATHFLNQRGVRIEIPAEHRWWEYGTAIQLLLTHYQERLPEITVLDVGAGWSALGPALQLFYNTSVTEYEPNAQCRADRKTCNEVLKELDKKGIEVSGHGLENMPEREFDAVFCISVLEHVNPLFEKQAWIELVKRVKHNGLFFMTTDCVPDQNRPYTFDSMRTQNFTTDMLRERVTRMELMGMTPLGKPDYEFHGSFVFDYSFFRAGMMKTTKTRNSVLHGLEHTKPYAGI